MRNFFSKMGLRLFAESATETLNFQISEELSCPAISFDYYIYPVHSDTLSPYHTCSKILRRPFKNC